MTTIQHTADKLHLQWQNGASVTFALKDRNVQGIREVSHNGVLLRNPDRLWKPIVETPEGIHYHRFELIEAAPSDRGGVLVHTAAIGLNTQLPQDLDEYLCDIVSLSDNGEVRDIFEWELWPSDLELEGAHYAGFAYRYRFCSEDGREIYRVFDDATWEIGGHVLGNTLLMQGQLNPPVTELKEDVYFTTACNYYGAEMRAVMGEPKRVSIQRIPRIGTLQAFDFMAHERGILFNYFDPTIEVLTLVHKSRGEDCLHFLDELRQPLTSDFYSYPKHILFCPTPQSLSRETTRNHWRSAYDFVHERERARADITASQVLPRVWLPQNAKEVVEIEGVRYPREVALYALADNVLPQWAEMGVKEVCAPSLWVTDYTVDRLRTKDESGLQGTLTVSGICCVRVHEIDPLWGGAPAVKYFTDRAHELGIKVQLWWATHLSRRAPIFTEHPEWMIRSRDGQPGCGGIGKDTIIPLDLNNPECLEWEYSKLKALHEATGIDGFFHDSYGNYTFIPVNHGDVQLRGQQQAFERLISRLQKLGISSITAEGIGPFATGHFGMNLVAGKKSGNFQYALEWWLGEEDMTYRLNMGIEPKLWPEREDEAVEFAFRCLAFGGRFGFTESEKGLSTWQGPIREQNQLHARLGAIEGQRTLLPQGQGVLWQRSRDQLLFAFEEFTFDLSESCEVCEVLAEGEMPISRSGNSLVVAKNRTYRIVAR